MIKEKIRRFTDPEELRTLTFVCQTGGKSPKVKWSASGFEASLYAAVRFRQLKITPKGVINVFDEKTGDWLGQIVADEDGVPTRISASEKGLKMSDFYERRA